MVLIRLDCKFDEEEGGLSLTTDNVLHYLGIIEERTMNIMSNYQRMKEMENEGANSSSRKPVFGKDVPLGKCPGIDAMMGAEPVSVNPPRLLDYSSDESGDDGADASLRPLHRSEIKYSKIASRAPSVGTNLRSRKTISITSKRASQKFPSRALSSTRESF